MTSLKRKNAFGGPMVPIHRLCPPAPFLNPAKGCRLRKPEGKPSQLGIERHSPSVGGSPPGMSIPLPSAAWFASARRAGRQP